MEINKNYIKQYLELTHPILIKSYIWIWIIMIDIIGIPTSILGILSNYTKWFLLPVILLINIWGFYILIRTEKKQNDYILFLGVYCLILPFILIIASCKIAQPIVEFSVWIFFILYMLIYFAILVIGFLYHVKALKKGYYFIQNTKKKRNIKTISVFSALGLLLGRVLVRSLSSQTGAIFLALLLAFLGYLIELGAHNVYKYYLIKKH